MAKEVKSTRTPAKKAAVKKTEEAKKVTKPATRVTPRDNSDINPEYTDAFIREVDEDVKNDNFKVLWNKYGALIVSFVVIAVCAAVCFDQIRAWKLHQNQVKTETYMAAAELQNNQEETLAALQKINEGNNGIFSDFAKLQIANILLEQGKTDEALASLLSLMENKQVNSEVKNIALIKYATYKVDEMPREEFAKLLEPVIQENNSWTPIANDLLAMSAIKAGDIETAKQIYQNVLKVKDLPEDFRSKIQDMLSSISDM